MAHKITLMAGGLALVALAACVETDSGGAANSDGLSGTQSQFDQMVGPCTRQAGRLTGTDANTVAVTDRLQTGGGPILTLSAGGAPYTCRLESDGSVTVFSEFAN